MNPLLFLPKELEVIIIDYKNQFEDYEERRDKLIIQITEVEQRLKKEKSKRKKKRIIKILLKGISVIGFTISLTLFIIQVGSLNPMCFIPLTFTILHYHNLKKNFGWS